MSTTQLTGEIHTLTAEIHGRIGRSVAFAEGSGTAVSAPDNRRRAGAPGQCRVNGIAVVLGHLVVEADSTGFWRMHLRDRGRFRERTRAVRAPFLPLAAPIAELRYSSADCRPPPSASLPHDGPD